MRAPLQRSTESNRFIAPRVNSLAARLVNLRIAENFEVSLEK
jgi:hypothetical protein